MGKKYASFIYLIIELMYILYIYVYVYIIYINMDYGSISTEKQICWLSFLEIQFKDA